MALLTRALEWAEVNYWQASAWLIAGALAFLIIEVASRRWRRRS